MKESVTAPVVVRFQRMATITVGAVIALILIGSLVRMTGSGMGCPDWPKCFGQWIPPTDISQLPENYQSIFAVAGREIADFDPFKTWTEYLNRLFGVLVGLLGITTFVLGFQARKEDKGLVWLSLGGLVMTIIAGGVGAYVVKTNLSEGMITIHMAIALGVLSFYLWALTRSRRMSYPGKWKIKPDQTTFLISVVLMVLLLSQILMGTQVREQVDSLLKAGVDRKDWIDALTGAYGIHKFSHYAVALALVWLGVRMWKQGDQSVKKLILWMGAFTGAEILMGLGMHHLAVPPALQPLHLLFASLLFTTVFLAMRWLWFGMKAG